MATDQPNVDSPTFLRSSFQVIMGYVKVTVKASCHNNIGLADANFYPLSDASHGCYEIRIDKNAKCFSGCFYVNLTQDTVI